MASTTVDKFLQAIQSAAIPDCDAWSADATLDATVPNWRMHRSGAVDWFGASNYARA